MKEEYLKWAYTFILLFVTIGWAYLCLIVVRDALTLPTPINILEASGTSVLLGALIPLNVNVNQYYFRKKSPPKAPPKSNL